MAPSVRQGHAVTFFSTQRCPDGCVAPLPPWANEVSSTARVCTGSAPSTPTARSAAWTPPWALGTELSILGKTHGGRTTAGRMAGVRAWLWYQVASPCGLQRPVLPRPAARTGATSLSAAEITALSPTVSSTLQLPGLTSDPTWILTCLFCQADSCLPPRQSSRPPRPETFTAS